MASAGGRPSPNASARATTSGGCNAGCQRAGWRRSLAASRAAFPGSRRELEGLAVGLEQPLEAVLLWNCRGDLAPTGPEGCSSMAVKGRGRCWLAHNEDGDPALRDACFALDATPDDGPAFFTFRYPGSLPGHTLAMNAVGLAYTVNNLRLTEHPPGIPRMVSARALLGCSKVDEALRLLDGLARSGGFHFMMADTTTLSPLSVEAPFQCISARTASPVAVHANHLVHPDCRDLPQRVTASSAARQQQLEGWCAQTDPGDVPTALLSILGDQGDPWLPIHRTDPEDPDRENTLATVVFTLQHGGITAELRPSPQARVAVQRRFPTSAASDG
ncbi:MAG: C45 family peptidase [Arhodomonas sp.]|nr:C45 family peptidase [Arhodomonas sp.]